MYIETVVWIVLGAYVLAVILLPFAHREDRKNDEGPYFYGPGGTVI